MHVHSRVGVLPMRWVVVNSRGEVVHRFRTQRAAAKYRNRFPRSAGHRVERIP